MEQPINQTVKERLKTFIDHKNMSVRAFEAACGLSYGFVGNMRNSMQPDKVTKITHCFPDLNPGWLMTGEGEMLKSTYTQQVYGGEKITQTGDINECGSDVVMRALNEISEMRKLLDRAIATNEECLKTSQRTNERLLNLLESMHSNV